jgi:hypothetical protein
MKYAITWREKPQGSPEAYEAAQRRILEVFGAWQPPAELKILQFVTRIGSWSGYMIAEVDDISRVQPLTTAMASFEFHIDPVIDVPDAVALEMEGMQSTASGRLLAKGQVRYRVDGRRSKHLAKCREFHACGAGFTAASSAASHIAVQGLPQAGPDRVIEIAIAASNW